MSIYLYEKLYYICMKLKDKFHKPATSERKVNSESISSKS
jgi:hypothetical protein